MMKSGYAPLAALMLAAVAAGCHTPPPPVADPAPHQLPKPPPRQVETPTPRPPEPAAKGAPHTPEHKAKPNPAPKPEPPKLAPKPELPKSEPPRHLRVDVRHGGGNARRIEEMSVAAMKNELSRAGYVVDGSGEPDIVIIATGSQRVFDRTGNSVVYEGDLRLHAVARGAEPSFIEEKTITARGKRGLDEPTASRHVAEALSAQTGAWAKQAVETGRGKVRPKRR